MDVPWHHNEHNIIITYYLLSTPHLNSIPSSMMRRLLLTLLLILPVVTLGFPAKKGARRKAPSSNTKGFGLRPPTLDDTVFKFRTRMPEDADNHDCPCGTGKLYKDCCAPFHRGEPCTTTTNVLRSRYSAFSWRNVGHVIATTHETCRDYREDRIAWAKHLNKGGMFDSYDFVNLEAGPEVPGADENEGFIEFRVTLRAKVNTASDIEGQETVITENSRFLRDSEGTWSYASGEVRSDVVGMDTILNN
jgi:SEC-C motif-containing protein